MSFDAVTAVNVASSSAAALGASGNFSALLVSGLPLGDWQLELLLWFQSLRHPVLTWIMGALTMLGDDLFYIAVLSVMYWTGSSAFADGRFNSHRRLSSSHDLCSGSAKRPQSRQNTFELMQLVVFSVLLNIVIKNFVDAPRPFEAVSGIEGLWTFTAGSASFPSGHAQTAATFWLALVSAGAGVRKGRRGGGVTIGIACSFIVLISLSRLYLGVHWPQDVLAGGLIGGVLGLLGPSFLKGFSRWFLIPTFALSAIGIFVFLDHSAVQLTSLLIGATIGHGNSGLTSRSTGTAVKGADADPGADLLRPAKPAHLLFGIMTVAAAYGTTTWLLTAFGFPELIVDGLATLETGLMITWGVPALLEAARSGT
ncbi:phosphatase PAP2 family protein [Acidaminobacter sp.]|uniref:phosphatase PAP2 family protein n=1 Tax=Acidaminobacter sp. TaxID=1872102 RepID=UPI001383121B|nr:phosphatase PAP2 family protein [Acidaminobacter sp.]MDK9712079.1 phosphatase PAP2 family protein [Acidaminobacter sp.]MZQ97573.1 phosphatase PAP2 family protein [Acidaminobacter sp.]